MGEYLVRCLGCGHAQPPRALTCQNDDSLLRTEYFTKRLTPRDDLPGLWKFYDWLPVKEPLRGSGEKPIAYRSEGLGRELGLENLYVSFSGYWPERGAKMTTCSFKDLEAPPTVERMIEREDDQILVVASAGNTARAFAQAASAAHLPLVLVVPPTGLDRLWISERPSDNICVISVNGDYTEAIDFAARLSAHPRFVGEGGARNVARRDGMGVVMLDGVLSMKALPKHYFQAVGSGTGGIAAWEASIRLVEDGRFGRHLPKLHLAQNSPCAPIYASWTGSKMEMGECPKGMVDDVLYNRKPPYAVKGGVKEALEETEGEVYAIPNQEAKDAQKIFEDSEDIDILPAAAVAVAALEKAVRAGAVEKKDLILLNITGGGVSRAEEELDMFMLNCHIKAEPSALSSTSPSSYDTDLLAEIFEVLGRRA
ncbi:MAG TPA: cysteate synthase [Methanothrix sp.]|nr:cysteate synthase [Methanothrix sp.]HPJ83473.1 cysteate synthase [Methanothrix sp.]HPR65502.1 cysteate synthase [Methanothrix sp.]